MLQNFADAILDDRPLIAPAAEGLRSVELANAMLLCTLLHKTVELPLDAVAFQGLLEQQIKNSRFIKKTVSTATNEDFTKSFGR